MPFIIPYRSRKEVAKVVHLAVSLLLILALTACGMAPRVQARQRLFLDLSLEFLGEYQLPKQDFQDTPVGGLSGITYDRQRNRFYAISDDRSQKAPARFYTLDVKLKAGQELEAVTVEGVTFLKNERGKPYPRLQSDTEGIALSPRGTLFISSEGIPKRGVNPWIGEFDLKTGQLQQYLPLPQRYLPNPPESGEALPRGVQENLGFEALTLGPNGLIPEDPFRLFAATESALLQDDPPKTPQEEDRVRLMHYSIAPIGEPVLVAEHLYPLAPAPGDVLQRGLTELLALDREGYWLSLERTLSLSGFGVKIFQVVNSEAADTSRLASLAGTSTAIKPLKKQLLLDLSTLGIELDNLEGMALGPRLADGSRTLLLVSDDNFAEGQVTQFLLFRLVGG